MVEKVNRYVCDACKKVECVAETDALDKWTTGTEIGDLCPACSRAWENYKQSFKERMRIDSGENLEDYTRPFIIYNNEKLKIVGE